MANFFCFLYNPHPLLIDFPLMLTLLGQFPSVNNANIWPGSASASSSVRCGFQVPFLCVCERSIDLLLSWSFSNWTLRVSSPSNELSEFLDRGSYLTFTLAVAPWLSLIKRLSLNRSEECDAAPRGGRDHFIFISIIITYNYEGNDNEYYSSRIAS